MEDDLAQSIVTHEASNLTRDVLVRSAVSAVAAHRVLFGDFLLESISRSLLGKTLEESGIENRDVRSIGHELAGNVDALEVRGVVQGSQGAQLIDQVTDLVGDQCRSIEVLTTLNDAVTNGNNVGLGKRRANFVKEAQNLAHANFMVGNGFVHIDDLLAVLVLDVALRFADALNEALGDCVTIIGVDKLVFDGGRTRVNNENGVGHDIPSLGVLTTRGNSTKPEVVRPDCCGQLTEFYSRLLRGRDSRVWDCPHTLESR